MILLAMVASQAWSAQQIPVTLQTAEAVRMAEVFRQGGGNLQAAGSCLNRYDQRGLPRAAS